MPDTSLTLYTYFRSSAAFRVRIALHWKGLAYESRFVHLTRGGGEQLAAEYAAQNPQRLVPLLLDGDFVLNQSLAMLEYLEEQTPEPPLLPSGAQARARVRALAAMVCCDIHPLQNLRVRRYLERLGHDAAEVDSWNRHFIDEGLLALETMLASAPSRGRFCHGDRPSLADVCLVPQLYNARRYSCDLARYPTLMRIHDACDQLPAFRAAAPEQQPDAEP